MRAYIGLGSNVGERSISLARARRLVFLASGDRQSALSSGLYETEPVGPRQPDFLNAVVSIEVTMEPPQILEWLRRVERTLGREPSDVSHGPRTIDLDLLAVDSIILAERGVVLPHPEMARRRFVLQPFCDIAPDWVHPVIGKCALDLLDALPGEPWVRPFEDEWWSG